MQTFPADPIEQLKFMTEAKVPFEARRTWLNLLSPDDRRRVDDYLSEVIRPVLNELGMMDARAASEAAGIGIMDGIAGGCDG